MKSGGTRLPITLIFFLLLFLGAFYSLAAQEEPPPVESAAAANEAAAAAAAAGVEVNVLTPEQNRIEMDIKTSSLTELAAWCRSLGLSEGGTKTDLAQRLRDYFKISVTAVIGEESKQKIITIESARSTEYFKIEVVDEEYARLSGEVRVSLKDGDAVHRIKAWDILFNRTRNILTASGGVEYIKEEGDKIETFRGESITVNLDNWSSIFLGGVSERSLQSDSTTYLFSGTVISRNDEEVTILNKASISNAKSEESLWSLNASRVWLLPGSDFAIFNAVLKVGEIPVLYIPFFYYPADEVVFHPVIGFRTREGNFVQTTTYILGRPKASSSSQSSLTKILGNSSDMEKKREGMFLRSTGKKAVDTNTVSLRAILDYYANLGGYGGLDYSTPKLGFLGSTNITFGIGFTRTIAQLGSGSYSPFYPNYDGTSDWNSSNFFSMDVPFRYRFELSSSISGKYGGLSWSIPYYSDPWVDSDFVTNRAEEMDWVNMIQQGAALTAEQSAENQKGAYAWQLTGNLNPRFPNMSPWISGITISGITSTISFKTKDISSTLSGIKRYSPNRSFYMPDIATLYSVSGSIAGTPLTLGGATPVTPANPGTLPPETEDPFKGIGVPRAPWEIPDPEAEQKKDLADKLVPPVLNQTFNLSRAGTPRFSIDYRFAPNSASELRFRSGKWNQYSDINWGEISSVLISAGGDAGVNLRLGHSAGLYDTAFSFTGNGTWRQYSYQNEDAEEYTTGGNPDPVKIAKAKEDQYRQSNFSTSYNYTASLRPLYQSSTWGSSSITYSLNGLAVKSNFTGTGDSPDWEMVYGEWNNQKITTHQFAANAAAVIMDKSQTFSLSAALPPKDSQLTGTASFNVWITETRANMSVLFPGEQDRRKLQPFYLTETFRFGTFGSLTHYMVLDTELKEFTTITTDLNFGKWGLAAKYSATRQQGYEYIPGSGWALISGTPSLKSNNFTLTFGKTFSQRELWNKRLNYSVGINSSLNLDLQRYTNSYFNFSLSFTLGINHFLDLTMSANSRNDVIFRYVKDWPVFRDMAISTSLPDGNQNNLFIDLFNSFRFDNDELRKSSGFKMKTFSLAATHHLGDWDAILTWSMSPYRPVNKLNYELDNTISFLVQWKVISEIKSDIKYNKRNDEWIVK
ncbi:MAG: LPS-assembly protein LptD [Treponema sp.]|jgi:hypothetical protein|nr:LPS-assembly protein LptD [Treponema sp.]